MNNLSFPNRITLELTNRCNLNCVFCPRNHMEKHLGVMSERLFKKAIDEMAEHKPIALVPFFRGESLLHPKFIELMNYAKDKGIGPIQLTTNGMLLNNEMGQAILDSGVDFVSFSMDTVNAEDYERDRVGAKYGQVVANIEKFIELRDSTGRKIPEIQVSSVATETALPYKERFIAYWIDKADRVRIFVEHSKDGSFGSLQALDEHRFEKRLPCKKVVTDMVVYWDGSVALCNHDWDRKEPIGNINEKTILEIWNGERYREIRAMHDSGDVTDSTCKGCDHWKMYYLPNSMIGEVHSRNKLATAE